MTTSGWTFTKTFHREPYAAISPLRPELSQAGRTVLITGGSEGIGLAIAKAFVKASASEVIITGRGQDALEKALASLKNDPKVPSHTLVRAKVSDMADPEQSEKLWVGLREEGTIVDVLVLNAAAFSETRPILESGTSYIWNQFAINVRAQLDFTERFYRQGGTDTKYLVNVSTFAIHDWNTSKERPGYGLTKNTGALVLQQIAKDTPPERMQLISYNPGPVFTRAARNAGYKEDTLAWNHPDLPGHFAVWAASGEAKFLHGRFVWTEWDIDELRTGAIRQLIDEDPYYLEIGVKGL